jgi:hypothetical protein
MVQFFEATIPLFLSLSLYMAIQPTDLFIVTALTTSCPMDILVYTYLSSAAADFSLPNVPRPPARA